MAKTYIYKVYDASNNFIETIDDVINTPMFSHEINAAGSELVLLLARTPDDYDEGNSIEFDNIVKIFVKDDDNAEPVIIFQGNIISYKPIYDNKEGVELTLYSLGYELNNFIYKTSETIEQNQGTGTAEEGLGDGDKIAQSFIPDQPTLTSVVVKMRVVEPVTATLSVRTDVAGEPNTSAITNGTATKYMTSTSAITHKFTFATAPTLTTGETYWLQLEI